jgi:hypothetical protein
MRVPPTFAGALCVLAIGVGSLAHAQDAAPLVLGELDRTDRRIEQAESAIAGADRDAARVELAEAKRIQSNARVAYGAHRFRVALNLTLRARARADRGIALVNGLPDPDRVREQLERTREVLDRVRERVAQCRIDRAGELLKTAQDMQSRAQETAQGGQYLAALQLTMGARDRAHRALRICSLEDNAPEGADRALRRTDEVLQRAQQIVSQRGNDAARRALAEGTALQESARRMAGERRVGSVMRLTLAARALGHRAIRLSGGRV